MSNPSLHTWSWDSGSWWSSRRSWGWSSWRGWVKLDEWFRGWDWLPACSKACLLWRGTPSLFAQTWLRLVVDSRFPCLLPSKCYICSWTPTRLPFDNGCLYGLFLSSYFLCRRDWGGALQNVKSLTLYRIHKDPFTFRRWSSLMVLDVKFRDFESVPGRTVEWFSFIRLLLCPQVTLSECMSMSTMGFIYLPRDKIFSLIVCEAWKWWNENCAAWGWDCFWCNSVRIFSLLVLRTHIIVTNLQRWHWFVFREKKVTNPTTTPQPYEHPVPMFSLDLFAHIYCFKSRRKEESKTWGKKNKSYILTLLLGWNLSHQLTAITTDSCLYPPLFVFCHVIPLLVGRCHVLPLVHYIGMKCGFECVHFITVGGTGRINMAHNHPSSYITLCNCFLPNSSEVEGRKPQPQQPKYAGNLNNKLQSHCELSDLKCCRSTFILDVACMLKQTAK